MITVTIIMMVAAGCTTIRVGETSKSEVTSVGGASSGGGGGVARIEQPESLQIVAVDNQVLDPKPWTRAVEIPPGRHRLAVRLHRQDSNWVYDGMNRMTLAYDFAGGHTYVLGLRTVEQMSPGSEGFAREGFWIATLVDPATGATLATPETTTRPTTRPSASGATVSGMVFIRRGFAALTAAGREVQLIPRSAQAEQWLRELIIWRENGSKSVFGIGTPKPPDDIKRLTRRTLGYGIGQFTFEDVPPGEYIALFDHPELVATADVIVPEGERNVGDVTLKVMTTRE